jgi:hypothetical protein
MPDLMPEIERYIRYQWTRSRSARKWIILRGAS